MSKCKLKGCTNKELEEELERRKDKKVSGTLVIQSAKFSTTQWTLATDISDTSYKTIMCVVHDLDGLATRCTFIPNE